MHETAEDLRRLQRTLDASYAKAGSHLRRIFTPERHLSAGALVRELEGVFLLDLATVTGDGAPRVAPIDGLCFRGRIWFGCPPGSARGRMLRARPAVSATCTRADRVCLIVHGTAREVRPGEAEHEAYAGYLREVYGPVLDLDRARYAARQGEAYQGWIEPRMLFAMVPHPQS